jgi:hypothetical protein
MNGPAPLCSSGAASTASKGTGDINGDGAIDAFDIEPFVACLVP